MDNSLRASLREGCRSVASHFATDSEERAALHAQRQRVLGERGAMVRNAWETAWSSPSVNLFGWEGDSLSRGEEWMELLERAIADRRSLPPPTDTVPFPHWIIPFVRSALDPIFSEPPHVRCVTLPASIREEITGWISKRLLALAGAVFAVESASKPMPSIEEICRKYPPLARTLCVVSTRMARAFSEFCSRLDDDFALLQAESVPRIDSSEVAAITPGLSDPHWGSRQVFRVTFTGDTTVYYKPKSLAADLWFQRLLGWLRERGGEAFVPEPLKIWDRGEYGWAAEVIRADCSEPKDLCGYYRRAGALVALGYALEAVDLIMDNLIASAGGPALIDAETLAQPVLLPAGGERLDRANVLSRVDRLQDRSVADTGLLPHWLIDAKGVPYNHGGLTGEGGYHVAGAVERWVRKEDGSVALVNEPGAIKAEENLPCFEGKPVAPRMFVADIAAGFRETYDLLLRSKAAFLDASDGPPAALAGCEVRLLFRPTEVYGRMIKRLFKPEHARSSALQEIEAETLLAPFLASCGETPPAALSLLREEIARLLEGEIPLFRVPCQMPSIPSLVLRQPLDVLKRRLELLSETDCARQTAVLISSLNQRVRSRDRDADPWARALELLPDLLRRRPREREASGEAGDTCSLYGPVLGPAIVAAALYPATGNAELRDTAVANISEAIEAASKSTLGGGTEGPGAVLYAAHLVSASLGAGEVWESAEHLIGGLDRFILHVSSPDVVSGVAGICMVLCALHEGGCRDERIRVLLGGCVEYLMRKRQSGPHGLNLWALSSDEPAYLGFAHGAAGVAAALIRAGKACGSREAVELGEETLAAVLCSAIRDSGVFGYSGDMPLRSQKSGWCHGVPGILVALHLARRSGCKIDAAGVGALLDGLGSARLQERDHVCCGNFSAIEALLLWGRTDQARALWSLVEEKRAPSGLFAAGDRRSDMWLMPVNFFKGLSGIAYALLRLSGHPAPPSVLGFEPGSNL